MDDFGPDFMDEFLPEMKDTLTVEAVTSGGQPDPNTGVPTGAGTSRRLLTQPCSDQDVAPGSRGAFEIVDGVSGQPAVSICITAWFDLQLKPGEVAVYRVNGRFRPLLRQGPPIDLGGQHQVMSLPLGPPEQSR